MTPPAANDLFTPALQRIRSYLTVHDAAPLIGALTLLHVSQDFSLSTAPEDHPTGAALLQQIEAALAPLLGDRLDHPIQLHDHGLPPEVLSELSTLINLSIQRTELSSPDGTGRQVIAAAFTELLEQASRSQRDADHLTPRTLSQLSAAVLDVRPGMRVLDFALGYGGTWLAVAARLTAQGLDPNSVQFVGQDIRPENLIVAACHLQLHGLTRFSLHLGDVLTAPQTEPGAFDRVIADPPFGLPLRPRTDWNLDPRFLAARTLPRFADWPLILHGLAALAPGGRAVFTTAHGPLFRSGSERDIRNDYVARWLTAVVALPSALYTGANVPVALTVFDRPTSTVAAGNDVLMVDASQLGVRDGRQHILSAEVVDRLTTLIATRNDPESPAIHESVPQARIAENDHSWQPSRYVSRPALPTRGLNEIRADLAEAHKAVQHAAAAMDQALDALNRSFPGENERM
ncbi:HsdM family class I SAM-dependent methyltransferase [Deinococcus sonorensis]|uniref:site-specific DNA-methyltransferase (adenine-specific) n=2 Tax=Deinococcus sonorensis TaxID=309891 RepID=A0AAU7UG18_9DEIO